MIRKIAALLVAGLFLCTSSASARLIEPTVLTFACGAATTTVYTAGTAFPPLTVVSGVTGASKTFGTAAANCGTVQIRSNSGTAMTDTLAAPATVGANWYIYVQNADATATDTITPASGTINGAASLSLPHGETSLIATDGSNYFAIGGNFGTLLAANNLSDLASASIARTNLGLGTAATQNTGTSGGTLPFLNGTNTWSGANSFTSPLTVTSATQAQVSFSASGANDFQAVLNAATSQNVSLIFETAGSSKWQLTKGTTDTLVLFDFSTSANSLFITTAGQVTVGEASQLVMPAAGGANTTGKWNIGGQLSSSQSTLPTVASCGTGSPTVTAASSDLRGSVTTGTAATSCTITFKGSPAFASAPFCVVSGSSTVSFAAVTSTSTTTLVLGISAAVTGDVITWHCIQ